MDIVERAINLFFLGKVRQAENILEDIFNSRKNDPRIWFLKALIEKSKGNLLPALNSIEKALELKRDYVEAWTLKASIAREANNFGEALRAIDEALTIIYKQDDYEDYELLIEKAKILYLMGNIRAAQRILIKVLEINPEDMDLQDLLEKIRTAKKSLNKEK
ncbi:MAG: tetratricopeptide repeat protein [Candidatus Njordarchaeales archaeon]